MVSYPVSIPHILAFGEAVFIPISELWILNPEFAVAIYCGLQTLAATLVSRFCSST
jgi:hypothetical protein